MKRCVIVGAGDLFPGDLPEKREGDLWIAADGGQKHLEAAGIRADLFLGDLDSLERAPKQGEIALLPRRKDDTDSVAAAKAGLRRGYRRFLILGGLGGRRLSHTAANFQLLSYLKQNGASGELRSGGTRVFLLSAGERAAFPGKTGYFSLFAATEEAEVTVTGALFSGEFTLSRAFPLGVSNEFGKETSIEVRSGEAFLILD